jgi:hypothetical protein
VGVCSVWVLVFTAGLSLRPGPAACGPCHDCCFLDNEPPGANVRARGASSLPVPSLTRRARVAQSCAFYALLVSSGAALCVWLACAFTAALPAELRLLAATLAGAMLVGLLRSAARARETEVRGAVERLLTPPPPPAPLSSSSLHPLLHLAARRRSPRGLGARPCAHRGAAQCFRREPPGRRQLLGAARGAAGVGAARRVQIGCGAVRRARAARGIASLACATERESEGRGGTSRPSHWPSPGLRHCCDDL